MGWKVSRSHAWEDTAVSQPARLRLLGEGVEAGKTWVYFHLLERKWKLGYRKETESPSFL